MTDIFKANAGADDDPEGADDDHDFRTYLNFPSKTSRQEGLASSKGKALRSEAYSTVAIAK